tara:strand:- start:116 stop:595 length:480 start_codon:yes stop_codon:yes gene_type:complete
MDHVLAHPNQLWRWEGLSENPNISFGFVLTHPEKSWNWYGLSENQNITFDMIFTHPEFPWNWRNVSFNPNITFKNVLLHPELPWDWNSLSGNTFIKEKQQFMEKRYNEHLSAYRIQQYWNKVITVPDYAICQRMLRRDYEEYASSLNRKENVVQKMKKN